MTEQAIATWRKDSGFRQWCESVRRPAPFFKPFPPINPDEAGQDEIEWYLNWEQAWADMGIPG